MEDALYRNPELAQFYDWDCPWTPDFDWFASLLEGRGSVLDIGCGTGVFTAAVAARGGPVVGVDPAAAMLDVARARDGGDRVTWIEADARGLDLGRQFDAVVMTGHAFQTLLTRSDRAACLQAIRVHLAPGSRFFFDSRNPEAREWEEWTPEATREQRAHPSFGMVERWNAAALLPGTKIVRYETHYRLTDGRQFSATSDIAFPPFAELADLIAEAGLQVDRWAGDPAGGPLRPGCPDFIPIGGPRRA